MGESDAYRQLLASDGVPLTQQRRTALRRWEADLAALVGTLPPNASLADATALPQLAARAGADGLPLLQAALEARLGAQHGGALAHLSAHYHDNQTSPGGADNHVLGGYSRVPAWLAARLPPSRLRLSTPVTAVRHGDTNATVLLASGQALTAQYVISTVPVGVLQAGGLALDPGLPRQAAAALAATGVGQLEKLWLEFDEVGGCEGALRMLLQGERCRHGSWRAGLSLDSTSSHAACSILPHSSHQIFWEGSGLCGTGALRAPCETIDVLVPPPPEGGLAWRRWLSVAAHTRRPVLVGLAAGESARRWAGMSDAQIVGSAMAALAAAFPGRAPAAPRAHLVTRWGSDPWSRGALSFPAAGGRGPSDRATLAEPLSGSLLLAGEAAWGEQAGSVHGALLSGGARGRVAWVGRRAMHAGRACAGSCRLAVAQWCHPRCSTTNPSRPGGGAARAGRHERAAHVRQHRGRQRRVRGGSGGQRAAVRVRRPRRITKLQMFNASAQRH